MSINDDYYSIDFAEGSFYYGYELTYCYDCQDLKCHNDNHDKSWCFEGNLGDFKVVYPAAVSYENGGLGIHKQDMFDVEDAMEIGIKRFMADLNKNYRLIPRD